MPLSFKSLIISSLLVSLLLSACYGDQTIVFDTAQLKAAIEGNYAEIVIGTSFALKASLPTVTRNVTIRGDTVLCKGKGLTNGTPGFCTLAGKRRTRHFTVSGKGSLYLKENLELRDGNEVTGGSIYVTNGGFLSADGIVFRFNGATGVTYGGGAIAADDGSSIQISNSNFLRNTAGFGGAIDVSGGAQASIIKSNFIRNVATVAGGAVSFVANSTGSIKRGSIRRNTAVIGGAVHIRSSTATACKIIASENSASLLGSVFVANFGSTLTYCKAGNSTAGDFVSVLGGTSVQDCVC